MEYARKELAANGTAALALMAALLEHFHQEGTLRPRDRENIIDRAVQMAPQDVGRTATEAREIIASMRKP